MTKAGLILLVRSGFPIFSEIGYNRVIYLSESELILWSF